MVPDALDPGLDTSVPGAHSMSRITHRYVGVLLALLIALGITGLTAPAPAQAASLVTSLDALCGSLTG